MMIKKKVFILFFCLLLSGCQKANVKRFYLGSDENDLFSFFEEAMNYPMPDSNVSYPLDQAIIENIEKLDIVNKIIPHYPLIVYPDDKSVEITRWTDIDNQHQTVQCSENYIFHLVTISDREIFTKQNNIIYDFESESGVFINHFMLEQLGFDIGEMEINGNLKDISKLKNIGNSLTIELEVSIPVSGHYVSKELWYQRFGGDRDCPREMFDIYEVDQYEKRTVELEIDGIVDLKCNEVGGNEIAIPYALAQEIYDQVDHSQAVIPDGSEPWQPTTYIIECDSDIDINTLGDAIEKIYPDYFLMSIEIESVQPKYKKAK